MIAPFSSASCPAGIPSGSVNYKESRLLHKVGWGLWEGPLSALIQTHHSAQNAIISKSVSKGSTASLWGSSGGYPTISILFFPVHVFHAIVLPITMPSGAREKAISVRLCGAMVTFSAWVGNLPLPFPSGVLIFASVSPSVKGCG